MEAVLDPITTPSSSLTSFRVPPQGGLLRSGNPGNKGGIGNTPSRVRKACRKSFAKRIVTLEQIADDKDEDTSERRKAIEALGRIGMGPSVTWDDIRTRLRAQLSVIRAHVPADQLEACLTELSQVWR